METLNDFIELLREHRMVVLIVIVSFWLVVAIVFVIRKYFLSKNKKNKDRVGKTKNLIILAPDKNNIDTVNEDPSSPVEDSDFEIFPDLIDGINEYNKQDEAVERLFKGDEKEDD